MPVLGPERPGGQGIDPHQEESAHRAIHALLTDPHTRDLVDLVVTWRGDAEADAAAGAYEVWARRGMVRFRRVLGEDGALGYEVLEVCGRDPLAAQDVAALGDVEAERAASRAGGFDADDPARRFVAPDQQSYPFAHERVAQLFDSPHAADLVVSPTDWAQGPYAGNHGALHVRQSRAPLWLAGPRVRPGRHALAARSVDLAPTVCAACGFPERDGADASGRTSAERGVAPDVYLARQDGRPLTEVLDLEAPPARRAYVFLLDGLHMTELDAGLAERPEDYPALARLRERSAMLAHGSIVNFPSITWPSHTSLGTGAWCGHHDVVNPSYYLRDKRETVSPQGQQVRTEGFASAGVESLYEAFRRVRGPGCLTAAIHAPFGRGADHAVLEGRNRGHRGRLKQLTAEHAGDCDPRWTADGHKAVVDESVLDNRGLAQVIDLFTRDDAPPPDFVYHELALTDGAGHHYGPHSEGLRAALRESDRRIGRVLDLLAERGLLDETLLVLSADHGMAPQDTALHANPVGHVLESGLEGVAAEPMLWLHDLRVEAARSADGRTGRVTVCENDALPSGERPGVEGAEVRVEAHEPGRDARLLASGVTGPGGVFGFPTPSDLESERIAVSIRAAGFNPRRLLLDGSVLALDLRRALYGDGGASG